MLLLDYLERIEVALRTAITDHFSLSHGFFWYLDLTHFEDLATFHLVNEEVKERFGNPSERFLKAFKAKYFGENMPPSHMAMELLTFGKLTRLYRGLKNKEEKLAIADHFGLPSPILSSWLIYLNNVRNICAHHSRLWNRKVTADRPTIPTRQKYRFHGNLPADFNTTLYGIVSMVDRLLMQFQPDNSFLSDFLRLVDSFPSIPTSAMGFPEDWRKFPAWGLRVLENSNEKGGKAA
jgi:abortive infection bacteriophage resistance protein